MKLHATYRIDGTTTNLHIEGFRITVQTWKGGRALIQVFDENHNLLKFYRLHKAYYIEVES